MVHGTDGDGFRRMRRYDVVFHKPLLTGRSTELAGWLAWAEPVEAHADHEIVQYLVDRPLRCGLMEFENIIRYRPVQPAQAGFAPVARGFSRRAGMLHL